MPLHLLGKKSWNVYNNDNIARVRRDEAAAAAAEEAEEQRMQELDAARRTAILRGETPPPIPEEQQDEFSGQKRSRDGEDGEHRRIRDWEREDRRKKRKLRGEDDTDRDIRLAKADVEAGQEARTRLGGGERDKDRKKDAQRVQRERTIVDSQGHISLFDAPAEEPKRRPREEAKEARKRDEEQGVGMRFSHAAGYHANGSTPWYVDGKSGPNKNGHVHDRDGKDAFGHLDPERKQCDQKRSSANDPMAFMNRAQTQLRQAEKDKADWAMRKKQEIEALEKEQREERRRRRKRRERDDSVDSLEGFSLDNDRPKHARQQYDSRDSGMGHEHSHRQGNHDRNRDREQRCRRSDHERDRR